MGKAIGVIIIFIVTILFLVTFANIANQGQEYTLNLPDVGAIKSVVLTSMNEQNEEITKEVTNNNTIQEILEVLNGEGRKTNAKSVQDAPVNVEGVIKVDFNHTKGGTSTLFLYKRSSRYYIEQPYNGIYQITSKEYFRILYKI